MLRGNTSKMYRPKRGVFKHPPFRRGHYARAEIRATRPSLNRSKTPHFAVLYHPFRGWYGRHKIGKKSSCNTRYNTPQRAGGGACARGRTRGTARITHLLQVSNPQMSKIWQRMTILSQFFSLIIKLLIDYDDFFPMIFWEEI